LKQLGVYFKRLGNQTLKSDSVPTVGP
jgi:hypothetical protein